MLTGSLASYVPSIWLHMSCGSVIIMIFLAHAGFIFNLIIGSFKAKADNVLKRIPLRESHYHFGLGDCLGHGAINRYLLGAGWLICLFTSGFNYEVSQSWALIVVCDEYFMSNSDGSVTHFSSLLVVSSLWSAFSNGWFLSTWMVWESKSGMSSCVAISTTYVIFSSNSYLYYAPTSA